MSAGLLDIHAVIPDRCVENSHFDRISLTDEWIRRRSGIARRAWFGEEEDLGAAAATAVTTLVGRAPDADDIGALIVVSTSQRSRVPGIAQRVATESGLGPMVLSLDVNAACCGFVYALSTALALCDSGAVTQAVVCTAEAMSRLTDPEDRQSAFLFGDGAAAVRLGPDSSFSPSMSVAGCDARFADLMTEGERGIQLRGLEVFEHAVLRMSQTIDTLSAGPVPPTVVVGHQANGRILQEVRRNVAKPDVTFVNRIAELGNTSSASVPLAFAAELSDGLPRTGRLAAAAYGAGESWGGVSLDYRIAHPSPVGPQRLRQEVSV